MQNYIAQWANIFPNHLVINVNLYLNDNTHEYWDFVKIVGQNFTDGGFGVCVAINSLLSFGAVSDKKSLINWDTHFPPTCV